MILLLLVPVGSRGRFDAMPVWQIGAGRHFSAPHFDEKYA
jgi:hypothetical protein